MEITNTLDFDDVLKNNKFVFVDFYADWCGPCKRFAPTFAELATKYQDICAFIKVNIDNNEEVANRYEVTKLPTFILFDNCVNLEPIIGANKDNIELFLQSVLLNKVAISEDF